MLGVRAGVGVIATVVQVVSAQTSGARSDARLVGTSCRSQLKIQGHSINRRALFIHSLLVCVVVE